MKVLIALLFLVGGAFAQDSYVNIFSTVTYNSGTNQVTGSAYTEPSYTNALYYNTHVSSTLACESGTQVDYDFTSGGYGGTAQVNLSGTGCGCGYYL